MREGDRDRLAELARQPLVSRAWRSGRGWYRGPPAVEVFTGNTSDPDPFETAIKRVRDDFV